MTDRRDAYAARGGWAGDWPEGTRYDRRRLLIPVESVLDLLGETDDLPASLAKLATDEYVALPASLAVCETCEGEGRHVDPSIDAHGITSEEWDRDWSAEDRESYLSGTYDVDCAECGGQRVVPVADEAPPGTPAATLLSLARDWQRSRAESRAADAYWARLEGGGY